MTPKEALVKYLETNLTVYSLYLNRSVSTSLVLTALDICSIISEVQRSMRDDSAESFLETACQMRTNWQPHLVDRVIAHTLKRIGREDLLPVIQASCELSR